MNGEDERLDVTKPVSVDTFLNHTAINLVDLLHQDLNRPKWKEAELPTAVLNLNGQEIKTAIDSVRSEIQRVQGLKLMLEALLEQTRKVIGT